MPNTQFTEAFQVRVGIDQIETMALEIMDTRKI